MQNVKLRMGLCLIPLLIFFFIIILFSQYIFAKDIEFILYKGFLQKLMDKIFPINISEGYIPGLQINESNPLGYKIDIHSPILSIQPKYIQVDAKVNLSSIFGNQTFPATCKFFPIYDSLKNNIEFKATEGKVNLNSNSNGMQINLGVIDFVQYISTIKIPLEINNINHKNKTIKPQCKNVKFQLLKDRVIITSEVVVE